MQETTTTRGQWHCPPWCTDAPDDHANESQTLDHGAGGALHHSQRLTVPGAPENLPGRPAWQVRVACRTDADGTVCDLHVYGDDDEFTPKQARRYALNLLRAVATAEDVTR